MEHRCYFPDRPRRFAPLWLERGSRPLSSHTASHLVANAEVEQTAKITANDQLIPIRHRCSAHALIVLFWFPESISSIVPESAHSRYFFVLRSCSFEENQNL